MSCSWKHLSSAGRSEEENEEEKSQIADDHMSDFQERDIEKNKEDYVPPSESSSSCDSTATITLTVANNIGRFIFCWSTVVLISP